MASGSRPSAPDRPGPGHDSPPARPEAAARAAIRPPVRRLESTTATEPIVDPQHQATKPGAGQATPPAVVATAVVTTERADPHTDGAVGVDLRPVAEAGLTVDRPLPDTLETGAVEGDRHRPPARDGGGRAGVGAAVTDLAERLDPEAAGRSLVRGRSVKILPNRILAPNSGVMTRPWRPYSPNPAWMARGMARALSFIDGTAW